MNFLPAAGASTRLEPSMIRLPIIALIDVMLFLLLYFIFSGALEAEERELATAIKAEAKAGRGRPELNTQYVDVVPVGTGFEFRIGSHRTAHRAELTAILRQLPTFQGAVLRVSDDVPVSAAATAAQACKDAGFTKVSYLPMPK